MPAIANRYNQILQPDTSLYEKKNAKGQKALYKIQSRASQDLSLSDQMLINIIISFQVNT
jgi:hypothetical protein